MTDGVVAARVEEAREAGRRWAALPLTERLGVIERIRRLLLTETDALLRGFGDGDATDRIVVEILPLADAARYLVREAGRILAPRAPLGRKPLWLAGVRAQIRREPCGVVLILAPGNYPLFLPGAQALQALAAGNAVWLKPSEGRAGPMQALARLLRLAGLPDGVLTLLEEAPEAGEVAVRAGVDKIVLTGSAPTGRRVLAAAAATLTPCVMELSGNDPVFVLPGADLGLVARCVVYGLCLNGGATCIAPRRLLVGHAEAEALEQALRLALGARGRTGLGAAAAAAVAQLEHSAAARGYRVLRPADDGPLVVIGGDVAMRREAAEHFGPCCFLVPVADMEEALAVAEETGYALGAAIFGPRRAAEAFAARVDAGSVVVNDIVVPTADPRLPFGGRGRSGFGATRGSEGLLEMTVLKTVSVRRGRFRPHLDPAGATMSLGVLRALHGDVLARGKAIGALVRSARRR